MQQTRLRFRLACVAFRSEHRGAGGIGEEAGNTRLRLYFIIWMNCAARLEPSLNKSPCFVDLHPNITIVFFYQLDAQILYFNTFIIFLYMFRALLCSSSGGQNCISAASGIVTLFG